MFSLCCWYVQLEAYARADVGMMGSLLSTQA